MNASGSLLVQSAAIAAAVDTQGAVTLGFEDQRTDRSMLSDSLWNMPAPDFSADALQAPAWVDQPKFVAESFTPFVASEKALTDFAPNDVTPVPELPTSVAAILAACAVAASGLFRVRRRCLA